MFIDSHAHLTDRKFDADREAVINRAAQALVEIIVDVGDGVETSRRCVDHARRYPTVYAAAGIYPSYAGAVTETDIAAIGEIVRADRVVAVGEVGLDFFRAAASPHVQEEVFGRMCATALKAGLPLIIHCRDAYPRLIAVLREMKGVTGVVHCFSGTSDEARRLVDMGFYLSIGGTLTFPKSDDLRETISEVPLERILIETDCPYLAPQPVRGKRNEPAFVRFVAEGLARVKGQCIETVARITTENARRLFERLA
jgi:TatD DNase family protein